MSNSADTNREYAYFRAVGSFYPTEMTGILGLEPTECWKAGDSFQRRGHILRRPSSCWKLDSGCNDTEELDAHVNALLARLRRHREGLLRAINIAKLQFVCVGFYYQNFSWELNFEYQKEMAQLGIGFWFDTYSFGDYHEEMVVLREQLGSRQDVTPQQE